MLISVAYRIAVRTSSDAASSRCSGVVRRPEERQILSLRTMFSMSMIASSTTTPTATPKPARIIVLIVAPSASSTIPAAASDSGIASRLTNAARHWNRNAISTNTTRMQPSTTANARLLIAVWMKVDCRKMCVSMWIPAGRLERGERLQDPVGDVERVRAGELLDHEHDPRAAVDDCGPDQRRGPILHMRQIADRQRLSAALGDRHVRSCWGVLITCRVADPEPLVRALQEAPAADRGAGRERQQPVVDRVRAAAISESSGTLSGAAAMGQRRPVLPSWSRPTSRRWRHPAPGGAARGS